MAQVRNTTLDYTELLGELEHRVGRAVRVLIAPAGASTGVALSDAAGRLSPLEVVENDTSGRASARFRVGATTLTLDAADFDGAWASSSSLLMRFGATEVEVEQAAGPQGCPRRER